MSEKLISVKKKGGSGGSGVVGTLLDSNTFTVNSANVEFCHFDVSAYSGKVIMTIGAQYNSVIWEIDLDNNTSTKKLEAGSNQNRTSVTVTNKVISAKTVTAGLGNNSGLYSIVQ